MSARKTIALGTAAIAIAGIAAFAVAEIALRVLPIPGVTFHSFYYDDLTGQRFYPGTKKIYRNKRGDHAVREVNSDGYLDREFPADKSNGTRRIAFFGDSFTEARQVPLERTFVRQSEVALNETGAGSFECLAIGMMGYGTTQSYLEYERWREPLQIDTAVYVFCENDPGNNVRHINRFDTAPYPIVEDDGVSIDFSFREIYDHKKAWPHRTWQWLKSHSLVFSVLETRLNLLRHRGVQLKVDEAGREMEVRAKPDAIPDVIAVPSSWPPALEVEAKVVTEALLREWKKQVERDGLDLLLLYIPRPKQLDLPPAEQDSWAAWLFEVCAREGIPVIDPTPQLIDARDRGKEIYYDHLSGGGHDAVAQAFVEWYAAREGAGD